MTDIDFVTLASVPGIGAARMRALLSTFGSATAVLAAPYRRLVDVPSVSRAAATAIAGASRETGLALERRARDLGAVLLTPKAKHYPTLLRHIPEPPLLLFAQGRLEFLEATAVAIVGSRDHSAYGEAACGRLAGEVAAAGLCVVSGMARGLDAVAHQAALDAGGKTVGVLGNGLGVVYPAANRQLYERVAQFGCLVTEFPPGEKPSAGSFPRRNRLISGLAKATLVVEAKVGSGALITADCALSQGREVMAVPGPITSPVSTGTNRLLQLGAKPVVEAQDVLEEYDVPSAPALGMPADLSREERELMELLADGETHVDQLCRDLGSHPAEILAVLTGLEIRGLVVQGAAMTFSRASLLERLRTGHAGTASAAPEWRSPPAPLWALLRTTPQFRTFPACATSTFTFPFVAVDAPTATSPSPSDAPFQVSGSSKRSCRKWKSTGESGVCTRSRWTRSTSGAERPHFSTPLSWRRYVKWFWESWVEVARPWKPPSR
jgi:DNA processing protein